MDNLNTHVIASLYKKYIIQNLNHLEIKTPVIITIIYKRSVHWIFFCAASKVDDMEISNIPSHEAASYEHTVYIGNCEEEFEKLNGINKIELVYYDEKEKKQTIVLSKNEIVM